MLRNHSVKTKLPIFAILIECVAGLSVIIFLNYGTFYERMVLVCLWLALLLPIQLGFLYSFMWQKRYPFKIVISLILVSFFYDFFMPTIMSIGIPLTLFNLTIVLPFILLQADRNVNVTWKTVLLGATISAAYVFTYSYFHYKYFV